VGRLLDEILKLLSKVRGPDRNGWFTALCPYHNDKRHPNLRLNQHGFKCFACGESGSLGKLAAKLGIAAGGEDHSNGLSVSELAQAKGISEDFLRSLGVADGFVGGGSQRTPCVDIPYMDAGGQTFAVRKRLSLSGPRRFLWRRGDHPGPYGIWRLAEARQAGWLVLVEGESDCWTLWYHHIPAIGLPGASTWRGEYASLFEGLTVYAWRETDRGGETFIGAVVSDMRDLRIIQAPQEAKDASALYMMDRDHFTDKLRALVASARLASQIEAETLSAEVRELYAKAKPALENPGLLHQLVLATETLGHVDDRKNAAALHLALISRLSGRPISVVVKGASSEGKSHLVHKVLEVHPTSAAYVLSAMSEHALAYSEEPLAHRFLVLEEGVALDRRFTTYLVRSLLSEGRLRYETVEKTKDGLKPRLIEREGPTGLISTTTAHSLDAETETRLLTLATQDNPAHVRKVLRAIADRRNRLVPGELPNGLTDALRWLELAGERKVVVPFATWLAEQLPVEAIAARLTRDFDALLAVVEASAMLHQCQRNRDEVGRIVATVADYAIAVATIGESFRLAANDSITARQRDIYGVVKSEENGISVRAVAQQVGIHPSSASRHLRALAVKGFLIDSHGDEKGKAASYRVGAPLPEEREVLPLTEDLAATFPGLAANHVDPVSGNACVCNGPPVSLQHCNTPQVVLVSPEAATLDATPGSRSQPDAHSAGVAVLQSQKPGCAHTPQSGRRRISL
jgi:hypothetical protein